MGGGRGKYMQGKIKGKKKSCMPINPKKYSCYGLKKILTRNLITKKILAARKFPPPPPPTHNFPNGPPLNPLLRRLCLIVVKFWTESRTTNSIFCRPSMLARLKWTDGSLEMWFLTSLITVIAGRKLSAVQWKTLPFLACVLFLIVCKFSCHMSSFVSLS